MESGLNKLSTLAVLGAGAAAIGVFLIIAANSIITDAEGDSTMTTDEYLDRLDVASDLWLWGEVIIGAGVFLVALAIMNKEPAELRTMRERLEKDFYRKCPSCGSWNTKFVPNCSTCGIMLPPLSEFQKAGSYPSAFKEGP